MGKSKKNEVKPAKALKAVKNKSLKKDKQKVSKPEQKPKVSKTEHDSKTDKKGKNMKGSKKDKVVKKDQERAGKKTSKTGSKTTPPEVSVAKPSILKQQSQQAREPPTRRISFKQQQPETSPSTPPEKVRRLSSPSLSVDSEDSLAKLKVEAQNKNMDLADYLQDLSRQHLDKEVEAHMTSLVAEQGDDKKKGADTDGDGDSDPGEDEAASDPSSSDEEHDKESESSDTPDQQLDEPDSDGEGTSEDSSESETSEGNEEEIDQQVDALVPVVDQEKQKVKANQGKKDTSQAAANEEDENKDKSKGNQAALQVAVQQQQLVGEKQVPIKEANSF